MIKLFKNICSLNNQTCVLCALPAKGIALCDDCQQDLPWLGDCCSCCALPLSTHSRYQHCPSCIKKTPHFDKTYAAFSYQFPINILLPKIKREQQSFHLSWLAHCLASRIKDSQPLPEVLLPVPISSIKRFYKGYNQTEQLAYILAKQLQLNLDTELILKNRDTIAQAQLNAKQRKKNLSGAFSANKHHYQHVAIIDDIMTTGSTANEIAKILKESGIKKVDVWVLARTLI